jgi:hypothetical protein
MQSPLKQPVLGTETSVLANWAMDKNVPQQAYFCEQ